MTKMNALGTAASALLLVALGGCGSARCSQVPARAPGDSNRAGAVAPVSSVVGADLVNAHRERERLEREVHHLKLVVAERAAEVELLRKNLDDAQRRLNEERRLLASYGYCEGCRVQNLVSGPPVPAIDATVAAVKADVSPALLLLSVGSDDRVEKGFHFSIYRGTTFIGKAVVEKVLRGSCGCRVLFLRDGETILPGDSAATRLQ